MGVAVVLSRWRRRRRTGPRRRPPDNPETIIVTGERVKRSLKDTPSSVAVFDRARYRGGCRPTGSSSCSARAQRPVGTAATGPPSAARTRRRAAGASGVPRRQPAAHDVVVDGRRPTYQRIRVRPRRCGTSTRSRCSGARRRRPRATIRSLARSSSILRPEFRARGAGAADRGQFRHAQYRRWRRPLTDDVAFRIAGDFRYSRRPAGSPTESMARTQTMTCSDWHGRNCW